MTDLTEKTSQPTPTGEGSRPPNLRKIPAFLEHMSQGWGTPDRTPPVVAGAAAAAANHRARLSSRYPGRTILVGAGRAPVRSNDAHYDFRPHSDFYWLTGCAIEGAVLALLPVSGGHDAVLFITPPAYPGNEDFFANANYGELWVGSAPDLPDWAEALQLTVRPLAELSPALGDLKAPLVAGVVDPEIALANALEPSKELNRTLAQLRMIKDEWEIKQLREAVDLTVEGFAAVISEIPTAIAGQGERWLQGTFDRHARAYGNAAGYATIVGSGKHAPTLHWVRCDGPVLENELLLLDMGVETRSFYTADVTRTFPASGTFNSTQRRVHDLVEKSHRAGLAAVGPGKQFSDFHHACMEVIAQGLHDWDLLPVSVDEALSDRGQHHRRFLVCGVGHHLGLDVHDCGQAHHEDYGGAALEPGMVLTVEPGLYFHENDLTVPAELRGIGVRLEDDILVTPNGSDVLSDALPLDADGIEAWMRAVPRA
ncbi:aminopeptidase P family protein [Arthrobacter tecti]